MQRKIKLKRSQLKILHDFFKTLILHRGLTYGNEYSILIPILNCKLKIFLHKVLRHDLIFTNCNEKKIEKL